LCLVVLGLSMKKAPDKSFLMLVREALGKAGEKIVSALMFVYFFLKALLVSNGTQIFFSEGLLSEAPWGVYVLPLVAFCILFGMGTARQAGRSAQFLFPFIAVSTLVIFALVSFGADYANLLPLFEDAPLPILKNAARYAMWYGDYSTLVVFFGSVKRSKHTLLLTNLAGVLASVAVLMFSLGLIAAFAEVGDILRFGQNVVGLSRFTLLGPASGRFDLLVFCVWQLSAFIKVGVFMYAASSFLSSLLGIRRGVASLSTGILLYGAILLCSTPIDMHAFFGKLSMIALVVQFVLPLFCLILACVSARRSRKEDGAEESQEEGEEHAAKETACVRAHEKAGNGKTERGANSEAR
ncbi:MAG: GerAB/ArcD/ProY family transporter, partial [Clostridiales bacterium]|nr:GerAB/ArcD/ProY family transporter [Clostridiales bacterium]